MYNELKQQLSEYRIETITKQNFERAFEVYDSNQDFFLLTQGEKATIESSIGDIEALPPGCDLNQKIYINIEKNGKNVGILDLLEKWPEQNRVWVGLLLIHGGLHGQKIGSGIVTAILNAAKAAGYESVQLGVMMSNIKGLRFWQKQGFEVFRTSGDIWVMKKELV